MALAGLRQGGSQDIPPKGPSHARCTHPPVPGPRRIAGCRRRRRFALVMGVGPAPSVSSSRRCDRRGHQRQLRRGRARRRPGVPGHADHRRRRSTNDDGTTSTTVDATTSSTVAGGGAPTDEIRSLDAAGAGTVIYSVQGGSLRLVSATPGRGLEVEVEQGAGREVELDFRSGSKRVQVNLELEDGQVRERVRVRDDADDTDIRTEDGIVVRDDSRRRQPAAPAAATTTTTAAAAATATTTTAAATAATTTAAAPVAAARAEITPKTTDQHPQPRPSSPRSAPGARSRRRGGAAPKRRRGRRTRGVRWQAPLLQGPASVIETKAPGRRSGWPGC